MKKTKIICTLGPSSSNLETVKQMILNGMNVARFNMSHGSHKSHAVPFSSTKRHGLSSYLPSLKRRKSEIT